MKRSNWISGIKTERQYCPQCDILGGKCSCEADYYNQQQAEEYGREQQRQIDQANFEIEAARSSNGEY
jgi:hypothetical protein